jgi:hypothetical protein
VCRGLSSREGERFVTGKRDRPQELPNQGTASYLLRLLLTSKRAWGALAIILIATALLPGVAKIPVALVLAALVVVPALRTLQSQSRDVTPNGRAGLAHSLRFDGFQGEPGKGRTRWSQVRCLVDGSDLRITSFWRPGRQTVVSLNGAVLTSIQASDPREGNLKSGRMRIIELKLSDASSVRLAVDLSILENVQAALLPLS